MLIPTFYEEIVYYVLIPIFVIILLFGLFILFYTRNNNIKIDSEARFKVNYWSAIVGIILGAILLTVSLGYSVALVQKLYNYGMATNYSFLLVILYIFPFVPLIFVILCIVRLLHVLKKHNEIIVEVSE